VTCMVFPPVPASARAARDFVRGVLDAAAVDVWPAELLVSELAANAIEHAEDDFVVSVSLEPVRIGVRDGGRAEDVARHALSAPDAVRGRGLVLIDELAARWGVVPHERGGKTVWFEI
jgi:anti-sigma regulatory factor (Ser/Thr protein kinase)